MRAEIDAEVASDLTEAEIDKVLQIAMALNSLNREDGDKVPAPAQIKAFFRSVGDAFEVGGDRCPRGFVLHTRVAEGLKRLQRERGRPTHDGGPPPRAEDRKPAQAELGDSLEAVDLDRLDARYDELLAAMRPRDNGPGRAAQRLLDGDTASRRPKQ